MSHLVLELEVLDGPTPPGTLPLGTFEILQGRPVSIGRGGLRRRGITDVQIDNATAAVESVMLCDSSSYFISHSTSGAKGAKLHWESPRAS